MLTESHTQPAAIAPNRKRDSFLPFSLPLIAEDEIALVVETLRSGWITTGPKVKRFEAEFAEAVDGRHTIAVNSATAALHLALEALGITAGDEVLVPTMTFAATAEVVVYLRAVPVLVDCEPDTLNIDPAAAEAAVTPRTRAIIPVHFAGHPCDMDPLTDLSRRHGLKVIEDAAHTLPARYKGRRVGTMSDVACFSFYATKTITTGEGGMIATDNAELSDRMRMMSLHGISRDAWKRYTSEGSWFYDVVDTGYKYNMTDVAAALGIGQLAKQHAFWEARRRIAARYNEAFADLPEIRTPVARPEVEHSWHLYVIQLDLDRLRIGRDAVIDALKTANIGTSVHFIPLHLHSYYRHRFGHCRSDFPRASAAFDRILTLPLYPRMTEADVEDVISAVRTVIVENRR
jgi:dTDP-4-amino-4,6-dideoxygalactose transaminase